LSAPGRGCRAPAWRKAAFVFFIYLRRELRRRRRQAVFIALGLALAIGLVITVTAASAGVQDAQTTVLHSLYGVGTDVTVTQPPPPGKSPATAFGFSYEIQRVRSGQIAAGQQISVNSLANSQYGTLSADSPARIRALHDVSGAAGGLTLTDVTVSGTVPALSGGGGSFASSFTTSSFNVAGVDLAHPALGALSAARLTAGRALTSADATADVAVADAGYAAQHNLRAGSRIEVAKTSFTIIGIVSVPHGSAPPDVYLPLARAQAIGVTGSAALTGKVNTIYVSAASAADIPAVQREIAGLLPGATVTDQTDLASQVSGSLASASTLASSLGRWLAAAVLIAAFGLASLLTVAAVARRVREFGTLKALGWRSRRIVGQVMGESVVVGVVGGAAGAGLGYAGAALIGRLAPQLSATVGGTSSAAAAAGGAGHHGGGPASALRALAVTPHTISVTLSAPVALSAIALAVALALAGGLIAGSFGGWRAARLRPAAALARVE
jgi:putative ABC transport system permease protein